MGLGIKEQEPLPVIYKDVRLDCGYRMDFVVEDAVIIEIKALEQLAPIHYAQLLSYLRLAEQTRRVADKLPCPDAEGWREENRQRFSGCSALRARIIQR
jgi:hypothetical protein